MLGFFEVLMVLLALAVLGVLGWLGIVISRASRDRMIEATAQFERQRHLDQQMSDVRALQSQAVSQR